MNNGKKLGLSIFLVVFTIILIALVAFTMSVNYIFGSSIRSGSVFGKNVFVMNSDVMEPEITNGSAVIADSGEISVLTEGNVILFSENSEVENIMRIVEVVHNTDSTVYRVAGDNAQDNILNVPKENVIAKCKQESQRLGSTITFFKSMPGIITGMMAPCVILLVLLIIKILSVRKRKRLEEEEIVYPETDFGIKNNSDRDHSQNPLFDPSMAPKPDVSFAMKKSSIAEHFGVKPGAKKHPDGPSERNEKTESAVEKFKAAVEEKPSVPVSKKVSLAPETPASDKSEKMAAIKAALNEKQAEDAIADAASREIPEPEPVAETKPEPVAEPQPEQVSKPKPAPRKEDNIKSIDDLIKALEEEKKKL